MITGLVGKKLGMTRLFTEDGRWIPVTVLEAGPCTVTQRKTREKDGYDAVQLGYGSIKERRSTKPMRGHFAKNGLALKRALREFRVEPSEALKPGDEVRADIFKPGDLVEVIGTSKGKGFAGLHKRHHFAGGPASHGSMSHRRAGSIGASSDPSKVVKGMRMAGHMGSARVTAKHLEVVRVDPEKSLVIVHGCVPGANGGLVLIRKSVRRKP